MSATLTATGLLPARHATRSITMPSAQLSALVQARHEFRHSPAMGKNVHMWTYGHAGVPVIAFPTAGGYAHEWDHHGVVEALADWLVQGKVRLYCPESNAAAVWIHPTTSVADRLQQLRSYEQFIVDELVPRARYETGFAHVVAMGCSVGALYTANLALKYPEAIRRAVCLSGRYQAGYFVDGHYDDDVYYSDPSSFVWNLHGRTLRNIQHNTHVTLVCGQGAHEGRCLAETKHLAQALAKVGVPHWLDLWGSDVSHEWVWWRRQIRFHLGVAMSTLERQRLAA
jgi:esterase/lipase superfamily enzyme